MDGLCVSTRLGVFLPYIFHYLLRGRENFHIVAFSAFARDEIVSEALLYSAKYLSLYVEVIV